MKPYQEKLSSYEELPLVLNVTHIEQILGISKTSAYALVNSKGFPATKLNGRLIRISKKSFFEWLEQSKEK